MLNPRRYRIWLWVFLIAVFVVALYTVRENRYYVKKFVRKHSILYNPAKRLLELKKEYTGKIFRKTSSRGALIRQNVDRTEWNLVFDASKSLGTYERFWGDLGFESFKAGTLPYRNRMLLEMMKETNARVGKTFRYIRAHNLYSNGSPPWGEGLNIYHENEEGQVQLYWGLADSVFDRIVGYGFKPIVEFGFMPDQLASDPERRQRWGKANISPPKDYRKWWTLVNQTVAHFRDRYGVEEISTWYFEVWNEPDLGWLFWVEDPERKPFGNLKEYFKLYDTTVEAAKTASPSVRIGGPASAGGDIELLLEHLYLDGKTAKRLPFAPIDFVSSHAYGPVGYDYRGDPKQNILSAINWKVGRAANFDHRMVRNAMKSLPFLLTETGPNTNGTARNNTEYLAAWLIKLVDGVFYLKDKLGQTYAPREVVYWAGNQVVRYFDDGKGIATYLKVKNKSVMFRRPVYSAFEALGYLSNERVALVEGSEFGDRVHGIATRDRDQSVEILVYSLDESGDATAEGDSLTLNVEVRNLPFSVFEVAIYIIDRSHSNVFTLWEKMGRPIRPDRTQLMRLLERNRLELLRPIWKTEAEDHRFRTKLTFEGDGVVLIRLEKSAY